MFWLLIVLGVIAGIILPVQGTLNARLGTLLGAPVLAALTNFVVGGVVLLALLLIARVPWPGAARLSSVPLWGWSGGLLGTVFVTLTVVLTPRLGTAVLFALVVVGQLLVSLVLDHFGLWGLEVHRANLGRVLGVALVVLGVVLFRRF